MPAAYDPLLGKIIARGADRDAALAALRIALRETVVAGLPTNVPWLVEAVADATFRDGRVTTGTAGRIHSRMPGHRWALLAAVAETLDGTAAATDPWAAIGPWSVSGEAGLSFHGEEWEERVVVHRSGDDWNLSDAAGTYPFRWWHDAAGVWTVSTPDDVARLAVVERPAGLEVAGNGGRWFVRRGPRPPGETTRRTRGPDGRVRAPLPARVLQLHVTTGEHVSSGQPLVTLSAMKMELSCESPAAGVVTTVACRAGQLVDADDLLVELRLDEQPAIDQG